MYLSEQLKRFRSIDGYLIEKGMTQEEIDNNKQDKVSYPKKEFEVCYEEVAEDTEVRKVPMKEIHTCARAEDRNNGVSWYYHLNGRYFDSEYNLNFEERKFSNLFELWKEMDISDIRSLYEDHPSMFNEFIFYKYIDEEGKAYYYQEVDGSHRLIVGKIIGVKNVYQNISYVYKANPQKLKLFYELQDLENKTNSMLNASILFNKSKRPIQLMVVKNYVTSTDKETHIDIIAPDFERLYSMIKNKSEEVREEIEKARMFVDNIVFVESNVIKSLMKRRYSLKRFINLKIRHKLYGSYCDYVSFSDKKKDEAIEKLTDYFEYELYLLKFSDRERYREVMEQFKEQI